MNVEIEKYQAIPDDGISQEQEEEEEEEREQRVCINHRKCLFCV